MARLEEIRARLAELKPEIASLGENEEITDDEARSLDEKITEFDTLQTELAPLEERAAKLAKIAAMEIMAVSGDGSKRTANNARKDREVFDVLEDRSLAPSERRRALVDGLLRANEGIEGGANQSHFEKVVKRHASDRTWAENMLARSRPEYGDAWVKLITGQAHLLTDDEKRAAITVATATAGGYLTPTLLDPTIVLTNDGTSNVVRAQSTVVTQAIGSDWNGVTSAGVTASFDGEVVEVSDDTPAFAAVNIPLFKAQAFVQGSIESFQDIAGLQGEIVSMFADAKDRLEGAAHCTGNGSTAPKGIFTALDADAGSEVTSTTAATIGEVDLAAVYDGLPVRHRSNAKWLMNPIWDLAIRRLGTAVGYLYTTDLTGMTGQALYGKEVILSDDAPEVTTTTALDQRVAFLDFKKYYIVDAPGSFAVEYIPHMFATANNLPNGTRGLYAYWRTGADFVDSNAGRLLLDKTSA